MCIKSKTLFIALFFSTPFVGVVLCCCSRCWWRHCVATEMPESVTSTDRLTHGPLRERLATPPCLLLFVCCPLRLSSIHVDTWSNCILPFCRSLCLYLSLILSLLTHSLSSSVYRGIFKILLFYSTLCLLFFHLYISMFILFYTKDNCVLIFILSFITLSIDLMSSTFTATAL